MLRLPRLRLTRLGRCRGPVCFDSTFLPHLPPWPTYAGPCSHVPKCTEEPDTQCCRTTVKCPVSTCERSAPTNYRPCGCCCAPFNRAANTSTNYDIPFEGVYFSATLSPIFLQCFFPFLLSLLTFARFRYTVARQ